LQTPLKTTKMMKQAQSKTQTESASQHEGTGAVEPGGLTPSVPRRPESLNRATQVYVGLLKGVGPDVEFSATIETMICLGVYPGARTQAEWKMLFDQSKLQLQKEGGSYE
jgi:hypothetical protein